MEKRYQVFVSSTREDLEDARAEVSQALLKANCFPAAMELFPAADEGIDDYIKQKIDESDYMVLIVAGRYGSVNPKSGKSYTEEEYDYAVKTGKPIIRLVHAAPFEDLPGNRIEQDPAKKGKLIAFRDKVTGSSIARLYKSDRELGAEVILGIIDAQQRHPSTGWVRADEALGPKEAIELSRLREDAVRANAGAEVDLPKELDVDFGILDKVVKKVSDESDPWDAYRLFWEISQVARTDSVAKGASRQTVKFFDTFDVEQMFKGASPVQRAALKSALLESEFVGMERDPRTNLRRPCLNEMGIDVANNYPLVSVLRD